MDIDPSPTQNEYFSSYEDLEVHKLMLEDEARTLAYKKAIFNNKTYFKDKVVLDVGCGSGILSIFCAQAGAKKVYAVEASNLAYLAKEIVKENNFEDVIEVIHSKVEDVTLPNNTQVDAIVSEWMGFYMLHEGMLDSVLLARDRFLKDGGEMFPESAVIYVAPCSVPSLYEKLEDMYGVSMKTFAKELRATKCNKPEILLVHQDDVLGNEEPLCWVSLRDDKVSDLDSFKLQHVLGCSKYGRYQGLCLWFECNFPDLSAGVGDGRVILDTSPKSAATHWKQTVIVLPQEQQVAIGDPIAFSLDMLRDEVNGRRYNLQVTMLDPEEIEHPLPCSCHMTKCILTKEFMMQHTEHALAKTNGPVLVEEEINDDNDDDDDNN